MDPIKVGIIIPSTTKDKTFNTVLDIAFIDVFINSFVSTYNTNDANINCTVYVGYDSDDQVYSNENSRLLITNFIERLDKKLIVKFIQFQDNVEKGHLSKMWNILYDVAYNDKCDYMYLCRDDIYFLTNDWLISSIKLLQNNNNFGISGPMCDNPYILTQALFSRKHKELIGFLVDEDIKNWLLYDWYNLLYTPSHVFVDFNHLCKNTVHNTSSDDKYKISNIKIEDVLKSVNLYKNKISDYTTGTLV